MSLSEDQSMTVFTGSSHPVLVPHHSLDNRTSLETLLQTKHGTGECNYLLNGSGFSPKSWRSIILAWSGTSAEQQVHYRAQSALPPSTLSTSQLGAPSNLGLDPKGASAPHVIAKTIGVHLAFFAFSWSSGPPKEFGSFCEIRFPVLLDQGIF